MMHISSLHNSQSEKTLQLKALGLTIVTCALLILFFLLIRWQYIPAVQPNPDDGGIEVNFGNSDQGLGDVAPMVPGDPAEEDAQQENADPPATAAASQDAEPQSYKEVAPSDDDVPSIRTSPNPRKTAHAEDKPIAKKAVSRPSPVQPVTNTNPSRKPAVMASTAAATKPVAPKAVYRGGHGTGGNGADSYNGVHNQGIAGGHGDQGRMGGDPNSDSYTGTGRGRGGSGNGAGSGGVTIKSGLSGRRFTGFPSFEDSFNENARIAVDIVVDRSGRVTSASINPRGTTTTNSNIRSIALRRARQLKFNAGNVDSQSGTVQFNFKLRG